MRRQVSMGVFYSVLILTMAAGLLLIYLGLRSFRSGMRIADPMPGEQVQSRQQQAAAEAEGKAEEEVREAGSAVAAAKAVGPTYQFVLKVQKGEVYVYDNRDGSLYMDTGFALRELPDHVQQKIRRGYGFQSQEELFAFLESYSS